MKDVYDELMEECGFEPEEARDYKPKLKEGLRKLLVTEEDVEIAVKERIPKYWTLESKGVRMLLKIWLEEFIYLAVPPPEQRIMISGVFPTMGKVYMDPFKVADPTIGVSSPDWVAVQVAEAMFHVGWKYVEAAEQVVGIEQIHCTLNKMRVGLHKLGILGPGVEMITHNLCDDAAMASSLINNIDGSRVALSYRCRNGGFNGDEMDPEVEKYYSASLRQVLDDTAKSLGVKITPEIETRCCSNIFKSMEVLLPIMSMETLDPPPLNGNDYSLVFLHIIMSFNTQFPDYDNLHKALALLVEEGQERVRAGKGVVPKGTPRVAWRFLYPFGMPWISTMCHEAGIYADLSTAMCQTEECAKRIGAACARTDVCDLNAGFWSNTCTVGNSVKFMHDQMLNQIKEYNLDGYINAGFRPCRTWQAHSLILNDWIGKETGIPSICPDIDVYMDRDFPPERMSTVIESFADMVKKSKAKREKRG